MRVTRFVSSCSLAALLSAATTHAATDPSAPVQLSPDESRALCLADEPGTSPIETALRADQIRLRSLPGKADEWVRTGWSWVRTARSSGDPGFYVNVDACAAEARRLVPDHVGARALRALVLMNGHRFEQARQEAEAILAADPQNTTALGTLSDALLELGRFDDAVAAAQRGADTKPDSSAYARAAYFRWLSGDRDGAKQAIRSALRGRDRRDPEPAAWTFVEAAKIFWNEGDYDGAGLVLAEALRWVPDYPPALVMLGRVALAQGKPAEAIVQLERAFRAQPLPEAAWLLADAHRLAGDTAAAADDVARVEQAGRRSDRLTLALFDATTNRSIDEALRLIEAERAGRGGVYVDDVYAWVLYRIGRLDEARRASDAAMRLGTPDARLLYHAGAIRLAVGDASGRALVEQALQLNPKFDLTGAAEAQSLLAQHPADTTLASAARPVRSGK